MTFREYDNVFAIASLSPCPSPEPIIPSTGVFAVRNMMHAAGESVFYEGMIEDPFAPRDATGIVGTATLIQENSYTASNQYYNVIDSILRYGDYIYVRQYSPSSGYQIQLVEYQISTGNKITCSIPNEADYVYSNSEYCIINERNILLWTYRYKLVGGRGEKQDQIIQKIDFSSGTPVVTTELTVPHYGNPSYPNYAYGGVTDVVTMVDSNDIVHGFVFGKDDHNEGSPDDLYPYVYYKNFSTESEWTRYSTQWTDIHYSPPNIDETNRVYSYWYYDTVGGRYMVQHWDAEETNEAYTWWLNLVFDVQNLTFTSYRYADAIDYFPHGSTDESNGKIYIAGEASGDDYSNEWWSFNPSSGEYTMERDQGLDNWSDDIFTLSTRERAYLFDPATNSLYLASTGAFVCNVNLPFDYLVQAVCPLMDDNSLIWCWDYVSQTIKAYDLTGAVSIEKSIGGFTELTYTAVYHFGDCLILTTRTSAGTNNQISRVYLIT